jgi:hypothetical protein
MKRFINAVAMITLSTAIFIPAQAMAQVSINIFTNLPPPTPQYEVSPAPRRGYVWAPGYWSWTGQHHEWTQGRWERARNGQQYQRAEWMRENDGWRLREGGWKDMKKQQKREKKEEKRHAKHGRGDHHGRDD